MNPLDQYRTTPVVDIDVGLTVCDLFSAEGVRQSKNPSREQSMSIQQFSYDVIESPYGPKLAVEFDYDPDIISALKRLS